MFTFDFDRTHRVVRVRFSGRLGAEQLSDFREFGKMFVSAEGPVHGLIDFSAIESVSFPEQEIVGQGQEEPVCPGYRYILIAPQRATYAIARLFSISRVMSGSQALPVVTTMDDAVARLGIQDLDFHPVDVAGLRAAALPLAGR